MEKPRWRAATTKLAARRLTSHSQGPGSVSSKSLQSKTSWRSGEPKTPKLERWASPQIWALRPERGVVERSDAMIERGTPEEGERRDEHAPVTDGDQLGDPGRGLVLEQGDRVGPVRAAARTTAWLSRGTFARAALPLALLSAVAQVMDTLGSGRVRQPDLLVDRHRGPPPRDASSHLGPCAG